MAGLGLHNQLFLLLSPPYFSQYFFLGFPSCYANLRHWMPTDKWISTDANLNKNGNQCVLEKHVLSKFQPSKRKRQRNPSTVQRSPLPLPIFFLSAVNFLNCLLPRTSTLTETYRKWAKLVNPFPCHPFTLKTLCTKLQCGKFAYMPIEFRLSAASHVFLFLF